MSETQHQKIKRVISIMDATSPTFCLAKWHHVTLYLQTGETHSCYHPAPHKIELAELKDNPSALHNTSHKKLERKEMLEGNKPVGCQYCWNIEAMGPDYISDRHIKTASIYTENRVKQIVDGPWNQNINPEYVEISFGNECNFKCGYCHPKANADYAEWSRIAAEQAIAFVNTGNDVNLINDYDWMNQQFINNYNSI